MSCNDEDEDKKPSGSKKYLANSTEEESESINGNVEVMLNAGIADNVAAESLQPHDASSLLIEADIEPINVVDNIDNDTVIDQEDIDYFLKLLYDDLNTSSDAEVSENKGKYNCGNFQLGDKYIAKLKEKYGPKFPKILELIQSNYADGLLPNPQGDEKEHYIHNDRMKRKRRSGLKYKPRKNKSKNKNNNDNNSEDDNDNHDKNGGKKDNSKDNNQRDKQG